jgi:hypothetical protein
MRHPGRTARQFGIVAVLLLLYFGICAVSYKRPVKPAIDNDPPVFGLTIFAEQQCRPQ